MLDGFDQLHALIEIVRRGPEVGYRAGAGAPEAADRYLIGCFLPLASLPGKISFNGGARRAIECSVRKPQLRDSLRGFDERQK